MNTFEEYILGEEEIKGETFVGMPELKWAKGDQFQVLLKGEFLNCMAPAARQKLQADIASGTLNKTQLSRAKKQAIEFIGSIVNASQLAAQNQISIEKFAQQYAGGSGTLLASASDKTPYFVCAHKSVSGMDGRAILPVADLKNAHVDMQKALAAELKTGRNPFLCVARKAKPADIVVPKLTGAMIKWLG